MKTELPNITLAVLLVITAIQPLTAQSSLDDYVREGLKSNLVLQEKNASLEQAQASIQIARNYFLPSVTAMIDYTSGDGGRSIAVPVGDLLNPVYASLNQLTQSDAFPQIQNVNENFFPKNFYDAKIRTTLPIINSDLYINKTIRTQQAIMEQQQIDLYKRQLVYEIKSAYYQYLTAKAAVSIYESAEKLVLKNKEINESLLRNGKALPANVLRSQSEVERVKADLASARNREANARKYFNFLLNRELDTPIDSVSIDDDVVVNAESADVGHREELKLLQTVKELNNSSLKLSQYSRLPKVNAFLDLGSQATDWQVNEQSRYYLVGVQLAVPLFQGFRTNLSVRQNKLEIEKTELRLQNTERQLQLSADVAQNNLYTTIRNLDAAKEQIRSAQSYFNLVDKGYTEGVHTLIEFLDARNQLTTAQLQLNLRKYEMLTASAQVERETASYSFQ